MNTLVVYIIEGALLVNACGLMGYQTLLEFQSIQVSTFLYYIIIKYFMIAPWYTGVLKFLHCSICNILSYHSYRFWGGVCKFIFLPYKQVECSTKIMMGCLQVIGIFTLEIWGFYSGHFTLCICVGVSNFPSCDVNLFNIPRVNLSGIVWDFSYVAGSVCRCCVL